MLLLLFLWPERLKIFEKLVVALPNTCGIDEKQMHVALPITKAQKYLKRKNSLLSPSLAFFFSKNELLQILRIFGRQVVALTHTGTGIFEKQVVTILSSSCYRPISAPPRGQQCVNQVPGALGR